MGPDLIEKDDSILESDSITRRLTTVLFGRALLVLDTCTSTNDVALKMALEGAPHGLVVIADEQTEGRGRHGRSWISPKGGIWMTLVLRPPKYRHDLVALPLVGALAIARALRSSVGIRACVRWPNDVVLDDRKLAGVLVETNFSGDDLQFALLGLGVNTNFHASLLAEISEQSTSLLDAVGAPVDGVEVICSLLSELENLYHLIGSDAGADILQILSKIDCSRGRRIRVLLDHQEHIGVLSDYETLTSIRLAIDHESEVIETGSVTSVEYLGAYNTRVRSNSK